MPEAAVACTSSPRREGGRGEQSVIRGRCCVEVTLTLPFDCNQGAAIFTKTGTLRRQADTREVSDKKLCDHFVVIVVVLIEVKVYARQCHRCKLLLELK